MKRILLFFSLIFIGATANSQTFNFTSAGVTGDSGPSQTEVNAAYSGTPLAGQVQVVGGIQYWQVPQSGLYHIEALGGQGFGAFHLIGF